MSVNAGILVEREENLEKLRRGDVLEEIICNVIRIGGVHLIPCDGAVMHSLRISCYPKLKEEAHVKINGEFGYRNSWINSEGCTWILYMEDYGTNEAALARYNILKRKIKDGKCRVTITDRYETSKVEFC